MKERIFVVRTLNRRKTHDIISQPYVSVSYVDENTTRHMVETFVDAEKNVPAVVGELLDRLISDLGTK